MRVVPGGGPCSISLLVVFCESFGVQRATREVVVNVMPGIGRPGPFYSNKLHCLAIGVSAIQRAHLIVMPMAAEHFVYFDFDLKT